MPFGLSALAKQWRPVRVALRRRVRRVIATIAVPPGALSTPAAIPVRVHDRAPRAPHPRRRG